VRTASIPRRLTVGPLSSRRLLALASDDTLVEQMRRGNEAAFTVTFERHAAGLLSFCRHMVRSPEEAEDAVQHTFVSAFSHLKRHGERDIALKPWLYAVARNRCLSTLRSRREQTAFDFDLPTEGVTEEVERRAELRALLRDLRELPEDQRAALLLTQAGNLSHAEVANVLGCEAANVKALVFRARSGLIQRRDARETACEDIREQLANLHGNSLRRSALRQHLRSCAGCRAYSEQVKRQRRMLAAALPVVLSPGLRSSVYAAVGLKGGSWGAGLAVGLGTGLSASVGAGTLVKVAAVGLIVGGAATSGDVLVADAERPVPLSPKAAAPAPPSSRPKPPPARGIAGRPSPHSVPPAEPRAAGSSADTWAQEQGSDSVPPYPARPDGDQGSRQGDVTNAAPSGEGAREGEQARSQGDDDTVGSAPGGGRRTAAPSSDITAYGGPAPGKDGPPSDSSGQDGPPSRSSGGGGPPSDSSGGGGPPSSSSGQGGPRSDSSGQGGPPSSRPGNAEQPPGTHDKPGAPPHTPETPGPPSGTPGKGGPSLAPDKSGPPSGTPGEAGPPPGDPAMHPPAEAPPPGQGRPEPKPSPERRPPATSPAPAPGAAPGPHPRPAPSSTKN
jgi:RNA polymerase sigma factor (sigma-70 family)